MKFSEYYLNLIVEIIERESSIKDNLILVTLGQNSIISNSPAIIDYCDDYSTFDVEGNDSIFNKEWFTKIFIELNKNKKVHLLSFAQFSYLIDYISPSFFLNRVIIINDNIRQILPIDKQNFIDINEDENIERRPTNLPIYQAEQIAINNKFYYSVKLPDGEYKFIDIFRQQQPLAYSNDNGCETIDVCSDPYALDVFVNECIANDTFNRTAVVKFYKKQLLNESIPVSLERINFIMNLFGGGLYFLEESSVKDEFCVNETTHNLLKKYWGENVSFRNIKVYKNPNADNEIIDISQGLIVQTILDEYENAKKNVGVQDLFLTAPTGAGKSLLFQLPAFYISDKGDVTIVVSPLIALMKDQVNAIINDRKFEKVAYLNSELSLIDRDKIIENCKNGEIDILYMSPELLLSYDISNFIGDRNLGLMVIDEAHLITTWGRDFRVDYWFLGNHIRKIRKYHNLSFPMVAVTATAIYGGANDMVFDSIDSLVMHNPHIFIGQVKRDDISFLINNYDRFSANYESNKLQQTVDFIKKINDLGLKTLVYTPYTKHIRQIIDILNSDHIDIATGYYGSLPPNIKEFAYRQFKRGEKKIMISTKAFGMGVDISDIEVVYHHAPSGLLPDYVQEIGRVARDPRIKGFATLNYSSQDQRFTKALHGMSSIRQYQLKEVLKKIYKTYIKNNKNRNLLLSVDDFAHIFENAVDLDQKVLTALMMIEKDYLTKHRFNVLIARPKKLFVKVYSRINDNDLKRYEQLYPQTYNFVCSLDNGNNIIEVDLDRLWYKHFNDSSFPILKREYYCGLLFKKDEIELIPQLKISIQRLQDFNRLYDRLQNLFVVIENIFATFKGRYFSQPEFFSELNNRLDNNDLSEKVSKFVLSSYSGRLIKPGTISDPDAFLQQKRGIDGFEYRVFNTKYLAGFSGLLKRLSNLFKDNEEIIIDRFVTNKETNAINYVRLGYFLEMLEIGTFEIKGGENPMVFVRINDPYRIEKDSNGSNYSNMLLSKTLDRHALSNQIFDYFFLRTFTNEERWNFIEDFFLGDDIDMLLKNYRGGASNNIDIISELNAYASNNTSGSASISMDNQMMVHIFYAKPDYQYRLTDLLTIDLSTEKRTMKISEWIVKDPISFDIEKKQKKIKIDKEVFDLLVSKLRANHQDYFKNSLGLNMRVAFKGYDRPIKASILYKDNPVDFYKWWCDNTNEIFLSFSEKIILFNRVNLIKSKILRAEHKKMLNKRN